MSSTTFSSISNDGLLAVMAASRSFSMTVSIARCTCAYFSSLCAMTSCWRARNETMSASSLAVSRIWAISARENSMSRSTLMIRARSPHAAS